MGVFKIEKCPECRYQHHVPKPTTPQPCPKCGTIMKYSDNYYMKYQVHGKPYVESVSPSKRFTEDALGKKRCEIREGKFFNMTPTTPWTKAIKTFEKWMETNVKASTMERYKTSLVSLTPFFKEYSLDVIGKDTTMAEEYKANRLKRVEPATVNRDIACLKRLFSLAEEEWNMVGPSKILKVKLLDEDNIRRKSLTHEQQKALIAECKRPHMRLCVIIVLDMGFREEELLSLERKQIDFQEGVITVMGKGDKERIIPMTERVRKEIMAYWGGQKVASKYAVNNSRGERILRIKRFERLCARAGIEEFTFHDLRHDFAVQFLRRTKDLATLQELLGHEDIKTTMRYAYVLDEDKKKAMKKFERRARG